MKEIEPLHILGTTIGLGESKELSLNVAKLHTQSSIDIPIIIERSKKEGPTVLISAGIHGDEINGVEIVRQVIAKKINKPKIGTIICIPLVNVFGFIHMNREFPDGRDLNRVFPGIQRGSLASRVAYALMNEIVPHVDLILDFHTGGSRRFNAPQIRINNQNESLLELAQVFGAPFIYLAPDIKKTFRNACTQLGIPMLLYEGGRAFYIDQMITNTGVNGIKRVLGHLEMLNSKFRISSPKKGCIKILKSKWIRANHSGMFKASVKINSWVAKNQILGHITDPYGKFNYTVKAPNEGYIFNINQSPIIYQGDAIFHISTKISE